MAEAAPPRRSPPPVASVCATAAAPWSPLLAVRGACRAGMHDRAALVGVNIFDALWCGSSAMASPCNHAHDVVHALRSLKESGLTVFRFFASLYGWRHVQWLREPARFWASFDRLMDEVESQRLQVVVCIGAEQWHEVANVWANASESLNDLVLDAGSLSRSLATRYATEVVSRYRQRPSVLFWELGNELNLESNMPPQRCSSSSTPSTRLGVQRQHEPLQSGSSKPRSRRCFGTAALVEYTRALVDSIRHADPIRPISSGFGIARPNAWHLERNPIRAHLEVDTREEWQRMVQWQHDAVDIVSIHVYGGKGGACWFGSKAGGGNACYRQSNLSVLSATAEAAAAVGKLLYIGEYGGAPPNFTGPSLAAQAFPEALLRWQEGEARAARESRVRTVSSIWSWTCAAKRASMYCIWPYQEQGKKVEEEGASAHMRERLVRVARRVGQY